MRSLKFKFAHAENILCFGPEGVDLHFSDYGQIIQVRGINMDNPGTKDYPASNGAGKSSIQEILSIGLFGKTVKNPTKLKGAHILNALADKGMIEVQWDDYRIIRSFKKSSSGSITGKIQAWESKNHIWDKESEITKGGKPGVTQEWIDERLGLNHHAFCNIVIFDDSNFYSFLESDTQSKRDFVENLLGLEQYKSYQENAKKSVKKYKDQLNLLSKEYELMLQNVDACDKRILTLNNQQSSWKNNKTLAINEIISKIKKRQQDLQTSSSGEELVNWQKVQEKIKALTEELEENQQKIEKVQDAINSTSASLDAAKTHRDALGNVIQEHSLKIKAAQIELEKQLKLIEKLDNLEDGTKCPVCYGVINKNSYGKVIEHSSLIAQEHRDCIKLETNAIDNQKVEYQTQIKSVSSIENGINDARVKLSLFNQKVIACRKEITTLSAIKKPDSGSREQIIEAEILELKKQAKSIKDELDGSSPYAEIITEAENEKVTLKSKTESKAQEIYETEEKIPYYQFWTEAFGDRGIRRYIVDGIIPALNSRISYWLSFLIDGKMELVFDRELEESITRNGTPASYYALSNGEKRRVNLAVSQAFSYVMMLNSGCCPSIVFLDEITGGGIDRAGIVGIYNMVYELAKERQVFVTTHNENLMSMLDGCQTLTLKKQNDITIMSS